MTKTKLNATGHKPSLPLGDNCWRMPDHQVAIGFGKTLLETVFVIAKPSA